MRLSAEAMNAALADFRGLRYPANVSSACDAFLAAKWVLAHENGALPTFNNIGDAVPAIFGIVPDNPLGRLAPFRYDWKLLDGTGRKTVWNNNSRGTGKKSQALFIGERIANGLVSNAAAVLGAMLPAARPSWQSLAVLVLRDHDFSPSDDWPVAQAELLRQLSLTPTELLAITSANPLGCPLLGTPEWDLATIPEELRPPDAIVVQAPADPSASALEVVPVSISVDPRVERMLRLAVKTAAAVLLVGPPGTGKGTLLKWMLGQIAANPDHFGFDAGFDPNPLWRTPDESWTSFELIGGLAPDPDGGKLRWTSGALMNAIEENRWLILDETNRGDMDKIMGPLMTWLSNQEAEVGRSETHGGRSIHIGWTDDRQSSIQTDDKEQRFLAGRDFRLFGTYNPQDAQRVFRFGQALSRRFVVIPVPAIRPGQFTQLLEESFPTLPVDAATAISGLYSAHLSEDSTSLGPAVFLRMAAYLVAGMPTDASNGSQAVADVGDVDDDGAESEEPEGDENPLLPELLAEAYVIGVGRYLAGFDERVFGALGQRIVEDEAALPEGQWTWVISQRNVLS